MYRHPPQINATETHLPSPTSDDLNDPESSVVAGLDEKRKELDQQIEAFKLQKEQEFRQFEIELRSRKRRSIVHRSPLPLSPPSGLSILNIQEIDGDIPSDSDKRSKMDDLNNAHGLKPKPGPCKASVSLNRVTINGMNTPPVSGTPPPPSSLSRSLMNPPATPPQISGRTPDELTKLADKGHHFDRLLTPEYVQLLNGQPASLPQTSSTSPITHSNAPRSTPSLPSTSLPSALRNASRRVRKRKHVTFRLAHSVVVDPSSSYEETSSPSEPPSDIDQDNAEEDRDRELLSPYRKPLRSKLDATSVSPYKDGISEASFFSLDEELADSSDGEQDRYPEQQHHQQDEAESEQTDHTTDRETTSDTAKVSLPAFSYGSLPIDIVKSGSRFKVTTLSD